MRAGLPDSRTQPSDHSVSNHLWRLRLAKARYLWAGRTEKASLRVFSQRELGASPFPSGLATSHRPNRVRVPTDWSFTSCCSPPRLATTQLQSVTSYVDLERTSTSPTKCTFRRTRGGPCGRPTDSTPEEFLQKGRPQGPPLRLKLEAARLVAGHALPARARPGAV
jgi:hypothetical protein